MLLSNVESGIFHRFLIYVIQFHIEFQDRRETIFINNGWNIITYELESANLL